MWLVAEVRCDEVAVSAAFAVGNTPSNERRDGLYATVPWRASTTMSSELDLVGLGLQLPPIFVTWLPLLGFHRLAIQAVTGESRHSEPTSVAPSPYGEGLR